VGAQAYLQVKRIGDGQHLLQDDAPKFVVRESGVIVVHLWPVRFGSRHANLVSPIPAIQDILEAAEGPEDGAECLPLYSQGRLIVGIGVIDRDRVTDTQLLDEYRAPPGHIPLGQLKAAWQKITPGLWVITNYFANCCPDDYFDFRPPEGCEITKAVKWQIWT